MASSSSGSASGRRSWRGARARSRVMCHRAIAAFWTSVQTSTLRTRLGWCTRLITMGLSTGQPARLALAFLMRWRSRLCCVMCLFRVRVGVPLGSSVPAPETGRGGWKAQRPCRPGPMLLDAFLPIGLHKALQSAIVPPGRASRACSSPIRSRNGQQRAVPGLGVYVLGGAVLARVGGIWVSLCAPSTARERSRLAGPQRS
mmetsp:Transcript_4809/g.15800  ORF Transcript_4809/g.15800 Transcript_4809/m.15800 type:complete len:201 (-) Transcript_4809:214-816(-)